MFFEKLTISELDNLPYDLEDIHIKTLEIDPNYNIGIFNCGDSLKNLETKYSPNLPIMLSKIQIDSYKTFFPCYDENDVFMCYGSHKENNFRLNQIATIMIFKKIPFGCKLYYKNVNLTNINFSFENNTFF